MSVRGSDLAEATADSARDEFRLVAVLLGAGAAVVVVALVVTTVVRFLGVPPLNRNVSDRQHRVTITIPHGWSVDHDKDAGQVVTRTSSGVEDTYRVPDIRSSDSWNSTTAYLWVEILAVDANAASIRAAQQEHVDDVCKIYGCRDPGVQDLIQIDSRPALEQIIESTGGGTLYVATLIDGDQVVRLAGFIDAQQPDGGLVRTSWLTAKIK